MDKLSTAIEQLRAQYRQLPIRDQFCKTLIELGETHEEIIALTADLAQATGVASFGARFPNRLVNVGIAEQNMTGIAAGLATCGKLPVTCGYAAFTTLRALEQAKVDCAYNQLKVILAGFSAGVAYGVGGPTHQTYEDLAIMRAIPNMEVLVPSDAAEVDAALRACVASPRATPIYLRLSRGPEYAFHSQPPAFEIGKASRIREGEEVSIIATGSMVFEAMLASDALAQIGIRASVVNMHSIKPLDVEAIRHEASRCRAMITVEEHSVIGGLGSAVLETLRAGHAFPIESIGFKDEYPPIGPTHALRAALGLSARNIAEHAIRMVRGTC